MLTIDEINLLCSEIAAEEAEARINDLADLIEQVEMDSLLADPRFYGPDEGADDSDGLFYWDFK